MSKKSNKKKDGLPKKKVVVSQKKKVSPTTSRRTGNANRANASKAPLIFGRQNYIYMAAGLGLIFLGLLLMTGGGMDNPNEWDPNVVYNWRRTILAPMIILAGLGMEVYAIFKDNDPVVAKTDNTIETA